jgi:cytochrome c5
VTLGRRLHRQDLPDAGTRYCEATLPERSIYRLLHTQRERLFPDALFADLFQATGRRSVPPSILAVVMVLQRLEGLSDREAADRFAFDVRWRYAAGVGDPVPGEETASFASTVLVDLRARLRASGDPDRIFRVTCELARQVGLVGVRRVLDSAALLDAVVTQDTVTLVRSAIRGLLRACPPPLAARVRQGLQRSDDYRAPGKPACDWDDAQARERLVDELTRDGYRALFALRGQPLDQRVRQAAELLAVVVGQDIEETDDGRFQIAQGTAPDRVISTVDPEARHGHKTAAHGFDGYKAHIAIDPDSEIITAAEASPATTSDADLTDRLLGDLVDGQPGQPAPPDGQLAQAVAYGDASYGSGANLAHLATLGVQARIKVALPTATGGRYAKTAFRIDLAAGTVTCPAKVSAPIIATRHGGRAWFGRACSVCPLRDACTSSPAGRTVSIHRHEAELLAARARQRRPDWLADYRATRPTVERKLAHLLRRRHGGRRARVRGLVRIRQDFKLLAAAVNLARLAVLDLGWHAGRWQLATA